MESELDKTPESELAEDLLAVVSVFSARFNGMRRYHKRTQDDQDDEGEAVPNSESEKHIEAMDGNSPIPLQQGKSSRKRKASHLRVSETTSDNIEGRKPAKRKRVAKTDTERSETNRNQTVIGGLQHELCQQEEVRSQIQEQKVEQN